MSIPIFIKHPLLVLVVLILCGCAQDSTKPTTSTQPEGVPVTCEAAVRKIVHELDEESVRLLKDISKDDLIQFHMTWGMGIRNSYGLWAEDSQLRKSCAERAGLEDIHPDRASGIIMEGVWEYVQQKSI